MSSAKYIVALLTRTLMSGGMDDENEYQRAIFEAIADEIIQQSTRGGKFGTATY